MNALKFNFEFSPLGFLRLLSPQQRAAIAQGNTQVLSRGVLGSAMLGAAYQFRNSEYAGEKWYEARLPDSRSLEGRLESFATKDIALGLLGMNLRAGTGLYAMDRILHGLGGGVEPGLVVRLLKGGRSPDAVVRMLTEGY